MRIRVLSVAIALAVAHASLHAATTEEIAFPASTAPAGGQSALVSDWRSTMLQRPGDKNAFGNAAAAGYGVQVATVILAKSESNLELNTLTTVRLKREQPLLLRFAARSIQAAEMTGQTQVGLYFQKSSPDWFKSFQTSVQPAEKWRPFDFPFIALRDYQPGEASMNFAFGYAPRVLQIDDVQLIAYPPCTELASLPRTQPPLGEPDPKLYEATLARIAEYRSILGKSAIEKASPGKTNTMYADQHSRDITNGEMTAVKADSASFFNNVVVTCAGLRANTNDRSENIVFGRDLFFNTDDILARRDAITGKDPQLLNPSETASDPYAFTRQVRSPLIGAEIPSISLSDDLFGTPSGRAADLGAIQNG